MDQVCAAMIDERVALEDLAPLLAQERGPFGEPGSVPPELPSKGIAAIPRELSHGIATHGALASHDVLLGDDQARARPLPSNPEEHRRERGDLLRAGHLARQLRERATGPGHAGRGVVDAVHPAQKVSHSLRERERERIGAAQAIYKIDIAPDGEHAKVVVLRL